MKAVLESVHSYLGHFCEERKPSTNQNGHASDAGYGGYGSYGFPLLIRRSKPKKTDQQLSRKCERKGSSRRRHHRHRRVHSLSTLTNSEPTLSPSHHDLSPIKIFSPSVSMAARIESLRIRDRSMGLRDCLVKMYSRRVAARKHAGETFDKYTSEYYSCGKKGVQNQRLACKFSNVDYTGGVDVSANSSASDSDVSDSSCAEGNASTERAQQIRLCGVSCRSTEKSCVDYIEHGKVSGLSTILAENEAFIHNFCHCISEASPILNTIDDHIIDVQVQKMGVFPEKRDHLHGRSGECDVGFCSQHEYDEEESSWGCGARGLRKKFPPPLNMLALQSHSDKRGRSPEACAAGYCLRSFRQDGRFVLQEVRAPTHKYFRVLREGGRLKLELVNAVDNSSREDDESSASDVCVSVKSPKVEVVTKVLYTSNTHAEDACKGTLHVGMHALWDETKNRAGSNTDGCVRTYELMSASRANVGVVKPLEQVKSAASDIQRNLEVKVEGANILSDVGASADEQMPQGNLMFAKEVGAEDMVSPLTEPPPSPKCPEMTTLYDGPSASIKRSWVRPISAF